MKPTFMKPTFMNFSQQFQIFQIFPNYAEVIRFLHFLLQSWDEAAAWIQRYNSYKNTCNKYKFKMHEMYTVRHAYKIFCFIKKKEGSKASER